MLRSLHSSAESRQHDSFWKHAFATRSPVPASFRPVSRSRRLRLLVTAASARRKRAKTPEPYAVLHSLRSALLPDGGRLAACQGTVQLRSPISVHGQGQAGRPFAVQLPPADESALLPLLDACGPAVKFGQLLDQVDTHKQPAALPADRFTSTFDLCAHPILQDVHTLLAPDARSIKAHPRQLDVYEPSALSYRYEHEDGPRPEGYFGLLLVCLPAPNTHGNLIVCQDDIEQTRISWDSESVASNSKAYWTAFHPDCTYEVGAIDSGGHVVLVYELTAEYTGPSDEQAAPPAALSTIESSPLFVALRAALRDPTFLPKGGTLGIACRHDYKDDINESGWLTPGKLRGADALAYAVAEHLQLQPELMYVFHVWTSKTDSDEDLPRQHDWYQIDTLFKEAVLESAEAGYHFYDNEADEREALPASENGFISGSTIWLNEADLLFNNPANWYDIEDYPDYNDQYYPNEHGRRSATALFLRLRY